MRKGGTKGEKNAKSDAKVWEIVARIRQAPDNDANNAVKRVLVAQLQDEYNFYWDIDNDRGTYGGSGVLYDGDRRQVGGKKGNKGSGGGSQQQQQRTSDEDRYGAWKSDNEDGYRREGTHKSDPFAPYKEPITIG